MGTICEVRAYCYRGDATNQEAIEKQKVHLSEVSSFHLPGEAFFGAMVDGVLNPDLLRASYARAVCDIQPVHHGTGSELYAIMAHELKSVGCPTWEAPELQSEHCASVFALVLDHGPDNQAATKMIRATLVDKPRVLFVVVWCFFHQYHLIVKNLLLVLDRWSWTGAEYSTPYFNGLATIANCWRSPGHPTKIYDTACSMFGAPVANSTAKKMPPRAVRGRRPYHSLIITCSAVCIQRTIA
jgi:hypothetical protein